VFPLKHKILWKAILGAAFAKPSRIAPLSFNSPHGEACTAFTVRNQAPGRHIFSENQNESKTCYVPGDPLCSEK